MSNIIDYLKDKIYYIIGGTIVIIVILVLISSCGRGGSDSYSDIEGKMTNAAKLYYSNNSNKLPKEEGTTIKVTVGTLIEEELLSEIKDPKDSANICDGYVEVSKVERDYAYIPFLTCKGNYEPKYLIDVVKQGKTDEYGNGVVPVGDEYIYKGDDVDNYILFNDSLWRIIKIDKSNDIKVILAKSTKNYYEWDNAYNSEKQDNVGITTDYLHTNIRKELNKYYEDNFTSENKSKIVSKDLCVGKYKDISNDDVSDNFSVEKECSTIKSNEKIGLLNLSDFQNASLDTKCINIDQAECTNYNYLSSDDISTWTLNSVSENTYNVYYISDEIYVNRASNSKRINPIIYLNSKVLISGGKGTLEEPYIIK